MPSRGLLFRRDHECSRAPVADHPVLFVPGEAVLAAIPPGSARLTARGRRAPLSHASTRPTIWVSMPPAGRITTSCWWPVAQIYLYESPMCCTPRPRDRPDDALATWPGHRQPRQSAASDSELRGRGCLLRRPLRDKARTWAERASFEVDLAHAKASSRSWVARSGVPLPCRAPDTRFRGVNLKKKKKKKKKKKFSAAPGPPARSQQSTD